MARQVGAENAGDVVGLWLKKVKVVEVCSLASNKNNV